MKKERVQTTSDRRRSCFSLHPSCCCKSQQHLKDIRNQTQYRMSFISAFFRLQTTLKRNTRTASVQFLLFASLSSQPLTRGLFLMCTLNPSNTIPVAQGCKRHDSCTRSADFQNKLGKKICLEITFFPFHSAVQRTAFMKITSGGSGGVTHNCADKQRG